MVEHLIVSQIFSILKSSFCLIKHIVNFLHGVWAKMLRFFFLGILYEVFSNPSHIIWRECTIQIFK